jgi:hypothetical protein
MKPQLYVVYKWVSPRYVVCVCGIGSLNKAKVDIIIAEEYKKQEKNKQNPSCALNWLLMHSCLPSILIQCCALSRTHEYPVGDSERSIHSEVHMELGSTRALIIKQL